MAAEDPSLAEGSPALKTATDNNLEGVLAGREGLLKIIVTSHAGMTTDEFKQSVADWVTASRHPNTGQRYHQMIYQPMLDLLSYLRENGCKT